MCQILFWTGQIAFCLSAMAADADIKSVEGWSNSRWGMTREEIAEVFKGQVVQLPKPEKFGYGEANTVIEQIQLCGELFKVWFLEDPKTQALKAVLIKPLKGEVQAGRDFLNPDTLFDGLHRLLIEKYGQPTVATDKKPDSTLRKRKMFSEWIFPHTIIELDWTAYSEPLDWNFFSLQYRQVDAAKLDKL